MKRVDGWAMVDKEGNLVNHCDSAFKYLYNILDGHADFDEYEATDDAKERGESQVPVRIIVGEESIAELEQTIKDAEKWRDLVVRASMIKPIVAHPTIEEDFIDIEDKP